MIKSSVAGIVASVSRYLSLSIKRMKMPKRIDLTGQKFGRLTVLCNDHTDSKYNTHWKCVCECSPDSIAIVISSSLRGGKTKSCGCLLRETAKAKASTHGMSKTSEYHIWAGIKGRCAGNDPNYGGRGIIMAPEWVNDFAAFYAHIGPRPTPLHSVDRIRVNEGYVPGNVKWATDEEQGWNRGNHHLIEKGGVKKPLMQWSKELGISPGVIYNRINSGWDEADFLVPVGSMIRKATNTIHGQSGTPEYEAWHAIKTKYAAEVCPEWLENPERFLADVGTRPSDEHLFMRIDASKPWAIDNVKWATRKEKQRNMASNRYEELDGERKTVAEWAEKFGIERRRLAQRLRQGWELRDALNEPFRTRTMAVGAAGG